MSLALDVARTRAPAGEESLKSEYLRALRLVERLHRLLLDVIKDEFDRQGGADLNSVQALLLYNIGESELTAGELKTRGYYLGSNVSYNLKKLVDMGYIHYKRSDKDRRSVRVSLTDKGLEARGVIQKLYQRQLGSVEQVGQIGTEDFKGLEQGPGSPRALLDGPDPLPPLGPGSVTWRRSAFPAQAGRPRIGRDGRGSRGPFRCLRLFAQHSISGSPSRVPRLQALKLLVLRGPRRTQAKGTERAQEARSGGMTIRRLALYSACAALVAGAAYFHWLAPASQPCRFGFGSGFQQGRRQGASRRAAPVTAATIEEGDMPVILSAPGTVEPLANCRRQVARRRADRRSALQRGRYRQEGSILFRLDDRMVKAQIAQADANIAKDQASLRDAEATLARRQALIGKQVVTEAALDQARYAVEGLKASIAAGQALLDSQKTQLDYLTIRAPITGRTGSLTAKLGATVRVAGRGGPGHHQPDETDPGHLCRAAKRACRGAARACLKGHGRNRGAGWQARVRAGHDQLRRQPGRQADRHHRRQTDFRERR